jgi:hypothetical protein
MKLLHGLLAAGLCLALLAANAQTELPKGFKKGTIVLADGSSVPGLIKDNMRSSASVVFLSEATAAKKVYDGSQLISAEIDAIKFLCINKDFFKIISEGELDFLQKSSDARGKVFYNGNEPVISSGTAGKQGDYFLYNTTNKELKLITKKNLDEVITTSFENHTAAIEKAKTVNDDLLQLKEAVDIYNKRNTN